MNLSIVILSYNTPDLIKNCVTSLEKFYKKDLDAGDVEVIIVDNKSEKENFEKIKKFSTSKKFINFIPNTENAGFGKGCNLGASKAKGEYILFLNSDAEVLDENILHMKDFLKNNQDIGIMGGKILNFDKTPQRSAGKFYNLLNFLIMIGGGEKFGLLRSSPEKTERVDWVSGAFMMVNKKLFNLIGGFDKNIFMYMEDMELSFRAKKKGIETYFYPDAKVMHKEYGSSNRAFAVLNIYKGLLYFYKKYKSSTEYGIVKFCLFVKAMLIYLLGKLSNNSYYVKTYGEALKLF